MIFYTEYKPQIQCAPAVSIAAIMVFPISVIRTIALQFIS